MTSKRAARRAAIYCRLSKADNGSTVNVQDQERACREHCERHGWEVVMLEVDNDISASKYTRKRRPGYTRVITAVESGAVNTLVVTETSRLYRRPKDLEALIDLADKGQVHVVAVRGGEIDLSTGAGRLSARLLVAVDAKASDDTSERLKARHDGKAVRGEPHGPRAFGYACANPAKCRLSDCNHDGMSHVPREMRMIRAAARDVLRGASLNSIARRWNAAGVLTPQRGRQWSGTVVKAVLTNPRHTGRRVHRGEVVGEAKWKPIIDRATHEKLVALLKDPSRRRKNPPRRQLFTGLIRSAETGLPLDRDSVRGTPTYRGHNRPGRMAGTVTISAPPLERLIIEALFAVVDGEGRRLSVEPTGDGEAADDLAAAERRLTELAEMLGAGEIDRAGYLTARKRAEHVRDDAQGRLAQSARHRTTTEYGPVRPLRKAWPQLSDDPKRTILAEFIDRVLIHPTDRRGPRFDAERVEVVWRQ